MGVTWQPDKLKRVQKIGGIKASGRERKGVNQPKMAYHSHRQDNGVSSAR